MKFVCICKNCSKAIEQDFIYCPWCGTKKNEPALEKEVENEVFNKLESKQVAGIEKRISELKEKLNELESTFESFLSVSENL